MKTKKPKYEIKYLECFDNGFFYRIYFKGRFFIEQLGFSTTKDRCKAAARRALATLKMECKCGGSTVDREVVRSKQLAGEYRLCVACGRIQWLYQSEELKKEATDNSNLLV